MKVIEATPQLSVMKIIDLTFKALINPLNTVAVGKCSANLLNSIRILRSSRTLFTEIKNPLFIKGKYDLLIMLDVDEKIKKLENPFNLKKREFEHEQLVLDTICNASENILFSAAIPGERKSSKSVHWHEYWVKEFEARGFFCIDYLRTALWNEKDIDIHYRNNILFFTSKPKELIISKKMPMTDVKWLYDYESRIHPELYAKKAQVKYEL